MVNNDLWDVQTIYGSGREGNVPANQAAALDDVYSAWGINEWTIGSSI